MNKYLLLYLAAVFFIGCLSDRHDTDVKGISYDLNQNMYSSCPCYPEADKPLKLTSSIVEDPESIKESLESKPCLMTMRVSEDFFNGYSDSLNGFKPRSFNINQEYVDGYKLADKDVQEGASRRLEAIVN